MPLYVYWCEIDGVLEVHRPLSEASTPFTCPHCGSIARRVFTPPNVPRTPKWVREGLAREEQSRHEPRRASREEIGLPTPAADSSPQWQRAHGRPWMIGH